MIATGRLPNHVSAARAALLLAAACALAACGDDAAPATPDDVGSDAATGAADAGGPTPDAGADVEPVEPSWCVSPTAHLWDPGSAELDLFPDGTTLIEDPDTPTGVRVLLDAESAGWVTEVPDLLADAVEGVNALSGFGSQGGYLLRFSAPVVGPPQGANATVDDAGWQLWVVDGESATRVPFETDIFEDNTTFILYPLQPLPLGAQAVLAVTTAAEDAEGGCIAPAEATRDLLTGRGTRAEHSARYIDALGAVGLTPSEISALTVFRTHNDIGPSIDAAREIAGLDVGWDDFGDCVPFEEGMVECTARITLRDYRNADGYISEGVTQQTWQAPLTVWLPEERSGPLPAVIFGHGLNGDRDQGRDAARRLVDGPRAVFALDALEHGDHPSVPADSALESAFRFLGLDLDNLSLDAFAARGNFEQTALDRLQLLRAILTNPDIDGDGTDDIDPDAVAYFGVSLGAIMAPQFLALQSDVDAAVLSVGGARLLTVATGSSLLADFDGLIALVVGSRELFDRLVPIAQHVVDPADSGVWAPLVMHRRLDDATPPSVLAQVALSDEVVPPLSGRALGRALDVPIVGEERAPIELLEPAPEVPLVGNFAEGARTAGFFQFDRITRGGEVTAATHVPTATSPEATLQLKHFFETWEAGGAPEILDPYVELMTPPLPAE